MKTVDVAAGGRAAGAHRGKRASRAILTRDAVLYCLTVFVGVRVILAILALASVAVLPHAPIGGLDLGNAGSIPGPVGVPGWPAHAITAGWHNVFTSWERFDALWYLRIASGGYAATDGSAAFFPLFPLSVRLVSSLIGGHPFAAGLLVSNGAALGALLMLYALTRRELSEETARGAVMFAAVFPTAFFFISPYSESLFLFAVLVTFWAARGGKWWLAGLAGAAAALTRNIGVLLALPLAVEAVHQRLEGRSVRSMLEGLAAAAGPVLGALAYLWYWHRQVGEWLAPIRLQTGWERQLVSPAHTLAQGTKDAYEFIGIYPGGYHTLDWLVAVPVLALAVYAAVRFRPTYAVYTWACIVGPLVFVFEGRPLMSFPRFALPLFPVFWALARVTERGRARRELALAASAALLGVLFVLFVNWYYVF